MVGFLAAYHSQTSRARTGRSSSKSSSAAACPLPLRPPAWRRVWHAPERCVGPSCSCAHLACTLSPGSCFSAVAADHRLLSCSRARQRRSRACCVQICLLYTVSASGAVKGSDSNHMSRCSKACCSLVLAQACVESCCCTDRQPALARWLAPPGAVHHVYSRYRKLQAIERAWPRLPPHSSSPGELAAGRQCNASLCAASHFICPNVSPSLQSLPPPAQRRIVPRSCRGCGGGESGACASPASARSPSCVPPASPPSRDPGPAEHLWGGCGGAVTAPGALPLPAAAGDPAAAAPAECLLASNAVPRARRAPLAASWKRKRAAGLRKRMAPIISVRSNCTRFHQPLVQALQVTVSPRRHAQWGLGLCTLKLLPHTTNWPPGKIPQAESLIFKSLRSQASSQASRFGPNATA